MKFCVYAAMLIVLALSMGNLIAPIALFADTKGSEDTAPDKLADLPALIGHQAVAEGQPRNRLVFGGGEEIDCWLEYQDLKPAWLPAHVDRDDNLETVWCGDANCTFYPLVGPDARLSIDLSDHDTTSTVSVSIHSRDWPQGKLLTNEMTPGPGEAELQQEDAAGGILAETTETE